MIEKIILHLCADIGSDTEPYRKAGYNVICVGKDIGVENYHPPENVYGIIANPPCTMFSIARTVAKTPRNLEQGMLLVKECLRIVWECQYRTPLNQRTGILKFWVVENPATGLLKYFLGRPTYQYSPHEFGDDFTKRTALWGWFNLPKKPLFCNEYGYLEKGNSVKDKMSITKYKGTFEERQEQQMHDRSICSPKFAQAFFEVNQ
jgi:hypothetical protein